MNYWKHLLQNMHPVVRRLGTWAGLGIILLLFAVPGCGGGGGGPAALLQTPQQSTADPDLSPLAQAEQPTEEYIDSLTAGETPPDPMRSASDVACISGRITNGADTGVGGVTIYYSSNEQGSSSGSVTSQSDGWYYIYNLTRPHTYTLQPVKTGFCFIPATRYVYYNNTPRENIGFIAYTVQGRIYNSTTGVGVVGVTVTLSPGGATTTTISNGYYYVGDLGSGNYTITPSKAGYTFTPPTKNISYNGNNPLNNINFYANNGGFIAGTIRKPDGSGVVSATVQFEQNSTVVNSVTTSGTGAYNSGALSNGTYIVRPSKSGYWFSPEIKSITVNGNNQSGINFLGYDYISIAGRLRTGGGAGIPNADITVQPGNYHTVTDGNGNYSLTNLSILGEGSYYTVTPSKTYYIFSPASKQVTGWRGFWTGINFIGTEGLHPPEDLTASDGTYTGYVQLTWSAPAGPAPDNYKIYRATSENGSYTHIYTTANTTYDDTTASPGTTYWYYVTATKSGFAESGSSNVDSGYVAGLQPPTGVTASDGAHVGFVRIAWTAPDGGPAPDSYDVYRATSENGDYTLRGNTGSPATAYDDTEDNDTVWWYKVKSCKSGHTDSGYSNADSGYSMPLQPPVDVIASDGTYINHVLVSWSAPASGPAPTSYEVYRATSQNGSYGSITVTSALEYEDNTATGDNVYWYKVKAKRTGYQDSGWSNSDDGHRMGLQPPTNLSATDGTQVGNVHLTWSAPGSGPTPGSYAVFRASSENGSYSEIGTAGGTSYDDAQDNDTVWWYKVKSRKSDYTDSGYSNSDSGYAMPLQPPTNIQASDGTYAGYVRVTWSAPATGPSPTGYDVYRAATENGTYGIVGDNVNSPWNDDTATGDNVYWYKVKSCKNGYDDSGYGGPDSGYRMGLQPPTNLSASDGTYTGYVHITWSAPGSGPAPDSYDVYRASSEDGTYGVVGDNVSSPWNDSTATPGTHYWYKAKSVKTSYADSAYSSPPDEGWRPVPIPDAPTNVQASDGTWTGGIHITWTKSANATKYQVFRCSTANGTYSEASSELGDVSGWDDTSVSPAVQWYYKVKAGNDGGWSGYSSYNSGWRGLSVPGSVTATKGSGSYPHQVHLTWSSVTGATGYKIYESADEYELGTYITTDTSSPYDRSTPEDGTAYYYTIVPTCALGDADDDDCLDMQQRGWSLPPKEPTSVHGYSYDASYMRVTYTRVWPYDNVIWRLYYYVGANPPSGTSSSWIDTGGNNSSGMFIIPKTGYPTGQNIWFGVQAKGDSNGYPWNDWDRNSEIVASDVPVVL